MGARSANTEQRYQVSDGPLIGDGDLSAAEIERLSTGLRRNLNGDELNTLLSRGLTATLERLAKP